MADGDEDVYDPRNYYGPPVVDMGEIMPEDYRAPGPGVIEVDAAGYYGPGVAPPPVVTGPPQPMADVTPQSMLPPPPPGAEGTTLGGAGRAGDVASSVDMPQLREPGPIQREMVGGKWVGEGPRPGARPQSPGGPGLQSYKNVNADILSAMGRQQEAAQQIGGAEADKALQVARARGQLAREEQEDAAIQQETARFQREEIQSRLREVDEQILALQERRIDPNQLLDEGNNRALAVVGGLIGGLYQGVNRAANNPFLDAMNRAIDRNIDAQEKNLRSSKEGVAERLNLIGHLRTIFKDEELARLQARNLYFEGAKQSIEAQAAEYDSPIIMAKSRMAIEAMTREQAEVRKQFLKEANAQIAAASAARAAQQRAEFERYKELRELDLKEAHAETERMKATGETTQKTAERFVATGVAPEGGDLPAGAPMGFIARSPEAAGKLAERKSARDALRAEINDALKIREDMGMVGRAGWREAPLGVFTPEWQVKLRAKSSALKEAMNKGSGLGAYDAGTAKLLEDQIGQLDAVGSAPDERLREALARLDRAEQTDLSAQGAQRATKIVGPDGRERVVPLGSFTAPQNARGGSTVDRRAPK